MAGFLLHANATVLCLHGGTASSIAPDARVRVSGQPIVTQPIPHSVAGCPFNVSGGPVPCVLALWTSAAVRVTANGFPVLLQDSQAVCIPNGTPVNIVATQTRVKGT